MAALKKEKHIKTWLVVQYSELFKFVFNVTFIKYCEMTKSTFHTFSITFGFGKVQ